MLRWPKQVSPGDGTVCLCRGASTPSRSGPLPGDLADQLEVAHGEVHLGCRIHRHRVDTDRLESVEVGVGVSLVLFFIVSKLTRPNPEQNLDVFFEKPESG